MYFDKLRCKIGEVVDKLAYDRSSGRYKISTVDARDRIYDLLRQEIEDRMPPKPTRVSGIKVYPEEARI